MDFDFLSSNLQIAYPFKENVVVNHSGFPVGEVAGLVAALRYYTYDQRDAALYADSLYLTSSDSFATFTAAKAELRWSDGTTVTLEDGVTAEAKLYSYGTWVVVTWRRTETDQLPAVLHLVFPRSAIAPGPPEDSYWVYKKDDDIEILSSLVKQGPGKMRRVFIKRGSVLEQVTSPGEEISVGQGFNMSIEAQDAQLVGGRELKPVSINAVPGAGMGQYLICKKNAYLLTVNGVPPNEWGGAKLAPEECYWLEHPLAGAPTPVPEVRHSLTQEATIRPNELQLHNACSPCCSCEDYVETYNHLRAIWDRAKVVSAGFYSMRAAYYGLVTRYLEIVEGLSGLLTLQQYLDDYMLIIVNVRNNTSAAIPGGVEVELEITPDTGTYTYVAGTGFLAGSIAKGPLDPADPNGDPNFTIDVEIPVGAGVAWSGMWSLSGMTVGDEIDVTALISNGISDSEARTLVIE